MRRTLIACAAALALAAAAHAASPGGPGSAPEPAGLHEGSLSGYTPATLKGAAVIDLAALDALLAKGNVVLLDVGPADRKPPNLPATALWRPQHRTIPDAVWMPGAGLGDLPADQEAALKARVLALTGGDVSRPVVSFCQPDCWGSWNLGKRLVTWGYTAVNWFPEGVNAWLEADKPSAIAKADPDWAAASKPAAER